MKAVPPSQPEQSPNEHSIARFGDGIELGWHEVATVMNSWSRCTKYFFAKIATASITIHEANAPVEIDAL
jgi:hypothetical protein